MKPKAPAAVSYFAQARVSTLTIEAVTPVRSDIGLTAMKKIWSDFEREIRRAAKSCHREFLRSIQALINLQRLVALLDEFDGIELFMPSLDHNDTSIYARL